MYGWENAGLMSPWSNAWGMQPQTIADAVVREQVAPAMGMSEGGDGSGFAVGGDPNAARETSSLTKDRVRDSLTGSLGTMAGKAALKSGLGLALGMPSDMVTQAALAGALSPSAIGGVLGNAVNATLGTTPQGFPSKAIANFAVPTLAGLAFGPVGGLVGGLMGGVVSDAVMDGLDARKNEALRDDVEDKRGYIGGRMGVADMQTAMNKANSIQEAVARAVNTVNKARGIAGLESIGYSPRSMSLGGLEVGTPGSRSYGGWGNIGGPAGGARAVDSSYGANMGGYAGLGVGNPSSYGGGRGGGDNDRGGFGANDGNSDTAGNAGFGR